MPRGAIDEPDGLSVSTSMDSLGDYPLPRWFRDMENHHALGCSYDYAPVRLDLWTGMVADHGTVCSI